MPTLAPTSRGAQDAHPESVIAGRIDAAPGGLPALVEEYAAVLLTFGRKPGTAYSYKMLLLECIELGSWTSPDDICSTSMELIAAKKRANSEWIGKSVNRAVTIVRGFSEFLARRGFNPKGMLDDVPTCPDDGGPGVRAATREEAERQLMAACAREFTCGYRRSNRPLQQLIMFLGGLRPGEAAKLEWKRHMRLDHKIAHIHWTKDIQKNRKEQDVILHPELVKLLKMHREAMRELAKETPVVVVHNNRRKKKVPPVKRPVSPDLDGSFVFPIVSSAFNKDAQRAKIDKHDDRGRSYAPRSARKFFSTEMRRSGVDGLMVDFLMRHKGGVNMRYFDPSMEDQRAAILRLCPLAPKVMHNPVLVKNSDLTTGVVDGHDVHDEDAHPVYNIPVNPADSEPQASSSVLSVLDAAGLTDSLQRGHSSSVPAASESRSFESKKAADRS